MVKTLYTGVDLHKTQFTVCIMNYETELENGVRYPVSDEGFVCFKNHIQGLCDEYGYSNVAIAIESTGNARFFRDKMIEFGYTVQVVNTLKFKVVNESTKKTDKNDARTLAEFLRSNMLPQSHLCSSSNEALRRIIKTRSLMVSSSVAIKNQIHAELLAFGIQTAIAQFQSIKSRNKVLEKLTGQPKYITATLFESLDKIETIIRNLEKHLKELTISDKIVCNLMTVPGIGIVNACIIKAYTDDISRFESSKNFSSFCGLVPWVQTSNESSYYGSITKRGPQELRTALVQSTVAMIRMADKTGEFTMIKQYHALKEDKCSGKAIIATARKLSCIIYVMMRDNVPFDQAKMKH